jgi:hypothetical protein
MLKLLLDEHVSPRVAEGLSRRERSLLVCSLSEWQGGRFVGVSDEELLKAATVERLTLVTYDRRTIPRLLKRWGEEEREHSGVVFVDDSTIPASDIGGLVRSLHTLWEEAAQWDWSTRT